MTFIRYLPFIVALLLLAVAVGLYASNDRLRQDLTVAHAELSSAVSANESLTKTIAFLTAMNESTEAIIAATSQANDKTRQDMAAMRDEISAMKESNNAIKEFLSSGLPDDIQRLLNRPENGNSD